MKDPAMKDHTMKDHTMKDLTMKDLTMKDLTMKDLTMIGGGASHGNEMNVLAMGLRIARVHLGHPFSIYSIHQGPFPQCVCKQDQFAYE